MMKNKQLLWPFGFYFLLFAGVAAHGPYRVLYFQSLELTGAQIGLLTGVAPLVTLVSLPLITGFADRTKRHKLIMSVSLLLVIVGLIAYTYLKTFAALFLITILISIFFSPGMALANSASMFMLGEWKEGYGRIRLGGTLGFSLVATVAGILVENHGLKIAFWSGAGILFLSFLVSQKLTHSDKESGKPANWNRVGKLLKNPQFLLFLLLSLSGGISFATLNAYLFPYMKAVGAKEATMGLALTIGTISEVPALFFAGQFIKRYKAFNIILFALAMTGLRFLLLGIATSPTLVLWIQLLNGLNYPLLTVAGITFADEHAPRKGFAPPHRDCSTPPPEALALRWAVLAAVCYLKASAHKACTSRLAHLYSLF
ncbi:MAG: MFS transporter [Ardenticatenaceae bacterium]|nr:MFS transporter [Ardenticatenaceae bacterium]